MSTEACLPLSSQQQLWCMPEQSGAFSPRFIVSKALRITGHVDMAALQAALDDVVARHEMLRTIIVRDAKPPYQQVRPPSPVPLTVRDLPPTPHQSRQEVAEDQLSAAEASSIDVEQLPLLRADLARFDSHDSVLSLVSHHSTCDGWSLNLVERDLAACYAARTGGHPLSLPNIRQYQDYARWQLANTDRPAAVANMAYWREQLDGAGMFTLPTDRPVPAVYTAPYLRRSFVIDADEMAAVSRFVKAEHFSVFMVMLAVFNVLAHRISGTLDPAISTMFHGRGEPQYRDTVGLFLNFLTMRTDLVGCRSFRDIVTRTRATCLQAYEHEAPHLQVMQAIPTLREPMANPRNSYLVFGFWDLSLTSTTKGPFQIGESASVIHKRERVPVRVNEQLPGGVTFNTGTISSGELVGSLQFSPETFDERTVAGWVSDYCRILTAAMVGPDREWEAL
ncbi:MAG: condensation enzyme [Pseudonocardiales bacterium]|nr:condensation enzyme [Pseudonocardiales bacterium]